MEYQTRSLVTPCLIMYRFHYCFRVARMVVEYRTRSLVTPCLILYRFHYCFRVARNVVETRSLPVLPCPVYCCFIVARMVVKSQRFSWSLAVLPCPVFTTVSKSPRWRWNPKYGARSLPVLPCPNHYCFIVARLVVKSQTWNLINPCPPCLCTKYLLTLLKKLSEMYPIVTITSYLI